MIKSLQFPVKSKDVVKQYCLYWITKGYTQALTGVLPYPVLQFKKKEFEKQIQYKSGKVKIMPV